MHFASPSEGGNRAAAGCRNHVGNQSRINVPRCRDGGPAFPNRFMSAGCLGNVWHHWHPRSKRQSEITNLSIPRCSWCRRLKGKCDAVLGLGSLAVAIERGKSCSDSSQSTALRAWKPGMVLKAVPAIGDLYPSPSRSSELSETQSDADSMSIPAAPGHWASRSPPPTPRASRRPPPDQRCDAEAWDIIASSTDRSGWALLRPSASVDNDIGPASLAPATGLSSPCSDACIQSGSLIPVGSSKSDQKVPAGIATTRTCKPPLVAKGCRNKRDHALMECP